MAILKKDDFRNVGVVGKIGNMVFYYLNGKYVGRRIGKVKGASPRQLTAREVMRLVVRFLTPIIPYIDIGFGAIAKRQKKNPYNVAVSLNFQAGTGMHPDVVFDFKKAVLSKGTLQAAVDSQVRLEDKQAVFSWSKGIYSSYSFPSDQVMLLVYYPEINKAVFSFASGKRSELSAALELPDYPDVNFAEAYISFRSANHKMVSDSLYVGRLLLS